MLLERAAELAALDGLLERSVRGSGGLLLIEAGAGLGKSALLAAAVECGRRQGCRIASARGSELEQGSAFGMVRHLMGDLVWPLHATTRDEVFRGAAQISARLFDGGTESGQVDLSAMLHSLYWLAANLVDRGPVLITCDDLQWADKPSVAWLAHLAERLDGLPLAVVAAARPGRIGVEGRQLERSAVLLRPARLRADSVSTLLEEHLGSAPDPAFSEACHRAAGGEPFATMELIRDLVRRGVAPTAAAATHVAGMTPAVLVTSVRDRLRRAGEPAAQVAGAVAVLPEAVAICEVAALSATDPITTLDSVERLVTEHLLDREEPVRFLHPLLRQAVYESLPAAQRARLHRIAADLLAASGHDPEQVAAQLLRVPPLADAETVARLRAAAALACRRGAPELGRTYLRRALAEPPDPDSQPSVWAELGRAEALAGDPTASETLERAWATVQDPVARAEVAFYLSDTLFYKNFHQRTATVLRAAVTGLGNDAPELASRLEAKLVGQAMLHAIMRPLVEADLAQYVSNADSVPHRGRPLRLTLALLGALRGMPGDQVAAMVDGGLDHGRFLAEDPEPLASTHAAVSLIFVDHLEHAVEVTTEVATDAARRGSAVGLVSSTTLRAFARLRLGQLADAAADVDAAQSLARQHGFDFLEAFAAAYRAAILIELGRVAEASKLMTAVELSAELAQTTLGPTVWEVRASTSRLNGDTAGAIDDLRAAGRTCASLRITNPNVFAWRSQLATLLATTNPPEAHDLADEELALARSAGIDRSIGMALRVVALLQPAETRLDTLVEASRHLEAGSSPLELARALIDLGATQCELNAPEQARGPLLRALDLAASCGAVTLADQAHTQALAAGARPRRIRLTGVDALTASERRVARLAADGASNREIAQELFVTTKTVKDHLTTTYRKLRVASRTELAAALDR